MKLLNYLNEYNEAKVEKLLGVFSKLPGGSPESIAKYILNVLRAVDIKPDGGGSTYLSGPMTNLPDDNWPVFMMAEKWMGGKVFNPAKPHGYIIKKAKGTFTWSDFMVEDVYYLLKCDGVVVLPGWSKSTGALTEVKIGEALLNTRAEALRSDIGDGKYQRFLDGVKDQYYRDGNDKGYDTVIEPMLTADTESGAAKYVTSYIPPTTRLEEGLLDTIKDMVTSVGTFTVMNVLKIIGNILDKRYPKNLVR